MSAFHNIAKWSLRALALWGVFELGAGLYDEASLRWLQSEQIAGHRAAMERLETRASALEAAAREANAASAGDAALWRISAPVDGVSSPTGAAVQLRDALMALGAQAPVVDGVAGEGALVTLNATWREAQMSAPSILHAIARQHPYLDLRQLKVSAMDGSGLVSVEAQFQVRVIAESNP